MTDHHPPRENDHLVEPMYAGLEVQAESRSGKAPTRWLLWAALVLGGTLLLAFLR